MADTSIRALSLDMGGTHVGCGLVEDERLLASTTVPSSGAHGLNSLLGTIERALHSLLEKAGLRPADCAGLAMGFPGIVDARTGKVLTTFKKYEDAVHLDLPQWSLKTFGIPLRMENDARMALLGEHHAGSAKGAERCGDDDSGHGHWKRRHDSRAPVARRSFSSGLPGRSLAHQLSRQALYLRKYWMRGGGSGRMGAAGVDSRMAGVQRQHAGRW